MNRIKRIVVSVAALLFFSHNAFTMENHFSGSQLENLNRSKQQIAAKHPRYLAAYQKLVKDADKAMAEGPFSVMDKKLVPPSGDKHDYLSLAPYWWPDPSKPDGKPYIRKDGQVNPETRGDFVDYTRKDHFLGNVNTLGHAFFFSDEIRYAEKVIQLLQAWFVDPATKMNPNLNFGQGVPGSVTGRPFGIIEFGGIKNVLATLEILKYKKALSPVMESSMQHWLKEYALWLVTSPIGMAERDTKNNHGTHYDVQLTEILLYLGEEEKAMQILESVKLKRIASQIEPDGSQPQELARTKSFSYSTMNLGGFVQLAKLGVYCRVDLWNFETSDGRSIRKAIDYMVPFIGDLKKWKYEQISNIEEAVPSLLRTIGLAAWQFKDHKLQEITRSEMGKADGLFLLCNSFL
jgi:hypothetical protein